MTSQTSEYIQMPVQEGFLDLAIGQPAPSLLPLELLSESNIRHIKDPTFLQYTHAQGFLSFRETLADFITRETKEPLSPERLMLSAGNSSATYLIATGVAAKSPRKPIALVESPSYYQATILLKSCGFELINIPIDHDGLCVEKIEQLLIEDKIQPSLVFTIPVHHNPFGVTLSPQRRKKLIELAERYHFLILADEAYQLLNFPGETAHRALADDDTTEEGVVFTIGSFSKIFAPAIRLGWVQAHPRLIKWLFDYPLFSSGGGLNSVMAGWIEPLFKTEAFQKNLRQLSLTFFDRCNVLYKAVQTHLPEIEIIANPRGGYFLWCRLPEGMDCVALNDLARSKYKTQFRPGVLCNGSAEYFRLCFAFLNNQEIEQGVILLSQAYQEYKNSLNRG